MRLLNARLSDGALADVEIAAETIAAVTPAAGAAEPGDVDLAGALLTAAFVEGHIHFDKTQWGAPRLAHLEARSVRGRIAVEREQRGRVALPVEARAAALIKTLLTLGVTRARTHVDVDADIGLAHLEAILAVREAHRDLIDIQIVAFPQSGVVREPGAADLLRAAMQAGADLVGGLDPLGFDGDVAGQLDIVFGLAQRFGKGVDIHLHDGGEPGAGELREIAVRAKALGMGGQVCVSHAFALGDIPEPVFAQTADRLADAGVAILTAGTPSVPAPPVRALRRRGVRVFAGSDNIRDCWSPFGDGDPLDRAAIIAARHEMYTDAELTEAFALVSSEADRALGDPRRGLFVGALADLVAMPAPTVAEAVVERPWRRRVWRRGRLIASDGALA